MFITKEIDGKKFHAIDPTKKKLLVLSSLVVSLIVFPLVSYSYYLVAINRPAQDSMETVFEIKKGDSPLLISEELYKENLINSKVLFNAYVVVNGLSGSLQAGVYKISEGTSLKDLVTLLQSGKRDESVTFLEGWRAEELARKAEEIFPRIDYEEFTTAAKNEQGYLFPDTYTFNKDVEVNGIIQAMRENFSKKTADILSPENLQKVALTKEEVVILASILEREVFNADDRPMVADILIKRYKNGELVGADATTQYAIAPYRLCASGVSIGCFSEDPVQLCRLTPTALESIETCLSTSGKNSGDDYKAFNWWPADLRFEEVQFNNPTNTRKVVGLPPSPISNPGKASIKAILERSNTDYYYYLTDSKGVTHYAKTLSEHNANISKYL